MPERPPPDVDLAGYALGGLDAAERERVEARVRTDPAARQELAELQSVAALLGEAAPAETPPPGLRERTLAAIEAAAGGEGAAARAATARPAQRPEPAAPAAEQASPRSAARPEFAAPATERASARPARDPHADRFVRPRRARGSRLAASLIAASVAALAGAGGYVLGERRQPGTVEVDAPLLAGGREAAVGSVRVTEVGIGRIVALETRALPELDNTREFYEVWFVGPDDSPQRPNRVSAGTFHPDTEGFSNVRLTAAVVPANYPRLSVTREPRDGDPRATGPEVLRARR